MKRYIYDVSIILIILLACGCLYIYTHIGIEQSSELTCAVYVNGTLYRSQSLSMDDEFTINSEYGSNTICIEDGSVYIKSSDCINKDCINEGSISNIGRSIICLPNRLEVVIEGAMEGNYDEISS